MPSDSGDADYDLRWFTPTVEVELCGHATLASAHRMWETGIAAPDSVLSFETASGLLGAHMDEGTVWLSMPADPPEECEPPRGLADALGARPVRTARCRLGLLAQLRGADQVRGLDPDIPKVAELDGGGVIVTATEDDDAQADFVSRFFAPSLGIDEDPVTGAAHCALGPYWSERLATVSLTGEQASKRGGLVRVLVGERVELGGSAVTDRSVSLRDVRADLP